MAKLGKKKFLLPTLCVFLFFVFAFFAIAEFNPVPKQTWPVWTASEINTLVVKSDDSIYAGGETGLSSTGYPTYKGSHFFQMAVTIQILYPVRMTRYIHLFYQQTNLFYILAVLHGL